MAVIRCKMCGGDLVLVEGQSVAECEYCGSRQTVPAADNEKKLTLFARAGRLRAACEFDKAAGIYETIVSDFPEEAEAYWGLVLCKYGIEYVDDPGTGKKIPTCHRSSFESILEDTDLEQALENADSAARRLYREEAKQIEQIRRGIIAVSANEQPYDIFICYKETDENGERTLDSVLAQDIYDALTEKGYRTFFSRITLEDKLGVEYEPYIFAALNSAKIMLAVGTDYEFYNAVWVKNEWSRYLKLMTRDKNKHLIPCYKGIDAYDMPREFAKLQAQDLGKMGAIQDILRGVEKILPRNVEVQKESAPATQNTEASPTQPLLRRVFLFLEDGDWSRADEYCEKILDMNPECAEAYLGKLLAELQLHRKEALANCAADFGDRNNYKKALRFADPDLKTELEKSRDFVVAVLEAEKNSDIENGVLKKYKGGQSQVIIPKCVSCIGKAAFAECKGLTSVEISADVAKIEPGAFCGCENLSKIRVSKKNPNFRTASSCLIDNKKNCVLFARSFQDVPSDGSIRSIADFAFYGRKELADIRIPEGVVEIGAQAFAECGNLRSVQVPRSITRIAANAFPHNPGISIQVSEDHPHFATNGSCLINKQEKLVIFGTDIQDLPSDGSVTKIGDYAFSCSKMPESIVLPACINSVGSKAFSECENLTSVSFFGKTLKIADDAFGLSPQGFTVYAFEDSDVARWARKHNLPTRENAEMKRISTASLLERGNQAIKVGDWSKAAGFFDGVLKNDSRNAQAYVGKTLVQEQCHTVAALAHQRAVLYRNVSSEKLYIKEDTAHISEMAERYTIPGYVDGNEIRKLYVFDRSYTSEVSGRQKQYLEEKGWWQNNRQFTNAEKFAEGDLAEQLQNQKQLVLSQLSGMVRKAQEADARSVTLLKSAYDTHVLQADIKAERLYKEGLARRQQDYQAWQEQAQQETDPKNLKKLAENFETLEDYQDSKQMAEYCRNRIVEEQEKIASEKKRQRAMAAEKKKARRRRLRPVLAVIAVITAACIFLTGPVSQLFMNQWLPEFGYQRAEKLFAQGRHDDAVAKFEALGDYEDAAVRVSEIRYLQAEALFADGRYQEAMTAFESLGSFEDSSARAVECELTALASQGIRQAAIAYYKVGNRSRSMELWHSAVLHKPLAAGLYHTVGLKTDGSVLATGRDLDSRQKAIPSNGQTQVQNWRNIISVSAGLYHTVGLRENGTVVATGLNDSGQCNVSGWTDIVAVAAGDNYTAGLRADGTVVITGKDVESAGNWRNVIEIAGGRDFLLGLRSDQTTVSTKGSGFGVEEDVISIAAAQYYLCLKEDGSGVGKHIETNGKKLQSVWAGGYIVLGILEDGTAAYKGGIVSEWTPEESEEYNLDQWDALKDNDIAAFAAGIRHAVLLKQDGTVTAFGENDFGGCNVKSWADIQIPQLPETDFSLDAFLADLSAAGELSELVSEGKVKQAAMGYYRLGYQEKSLELWNRIADRETISAGIYHTVGLRNDGTVVAAGSNWDAKKKRIAADGQCDVGSWENIVDIEAGDYHTVGLKADGTVVATGLNTEGQCDVSDWSGIVAVAAGAYYSAGLRADGTVVVTGISRVGNAASWTDIISLAGGDEFIIGLKMDGTTISTSAAIADRENVAKIAAGIAYIYLHKDGTVSSPYSHNAFKELENVEDIYASSEATICRQQDGSLHVNLLFGKNFRGKSDVKELRAWTALERDDVVGFSATEYHAVILLSDGTVMACGDNESGRCDVKNWTDIRIPNLSPMPGKDALSQAEKVTDAATAYMKAESYLADGEILKAAMAFGKLGDFEDSRERSLTLWNAARPMETISAGQFHTMAVQKNGNMLITYEKIIPGSMVAVSDGNWHYVGLRSDGRVVSRLMDTDLPGINNGNHGQTKVNNWKDIVAVSAGDMHTLGLRKNGTVIGAGINDFGRWRTDTWQNIVAVSAGYDHSVGLDADGHVFTIGGNKNGVADTTLWKDIVAVSAGKFFTVGLSMDGTVIAAGNNDFGQCDVGNLRSIVAVSAGNTHTVALRSDGTVVAIGGNEYGQCDVSTWRDIVAIDAGGWHTVGLKSDGTMVAVGHTGDGRCDVSDWKNVKLPYKDSTDFPDTWTDGKLPATQQNPAEHMDPAAGYVEAENLLASGETAKAAIVFGKLGDYEDARQRSFDLWDKIARRRTFDCGYAHIVALRNDGTVAAVGSNDADYLLGGQNVESWRNIIAVDADHLLTVGLTAHGTVVAAGMRFRGENGNSTESADWEADWEDIVAISAGSLSTVAGLKMDGTVVVAGYATEWNDTSDWTDIIDVQAHGDRIIGLRSDGTVVTTSEHLHSVLSDWKNVVRIDAGYSGIMALTADGSVLTDSDTDLSGWENIVEMDTSRTTCYIGVTEDGKVLSAGLHEHLAAQISEWTDIAHVYVAENRADNYYFIGLKKNGTLVTLGSAGEVGNQEKWSDLIDMSTFLATTTGNRCYVAGLKKDGTIVTNTGFDTSYWTDIALPGQLKSKPKETIAVSQMDHQAQYTAAEELLASGETAKAAIAFGKLGDYEDARQRSMDAWSQCAVRELIATSTHTVGIRSNGSVAAVGSNDDGECKVSGWKDIVAVSVNLSHTVGLKADGTVLAVGRNDNGKCDVSDWRDIVDISAGSGHTAGLKSDGTVVAVGWNGCEVSDWQDIADISAGGNHTVGLKSDGTVVATGMNDKGQCNVSDWKNIVAVSAGYDNTAGLKADGTVVVVGSNEFGQRNISDWQDIVSVSAGSGSVVGLKSDGTVVIAGRKDQGIGGVSDWQDIVAVSASYYHCVGLKSDGAVVAAGANNWGQGNVFDWSDMKLPQ